MNTTTYLIENKQIADCFYSQLQLSVAVVLEGSYV